MTLRRMNDPAASCGIKGQSVSNCRKRRVGRGAQHRNPPLRTTGFAESTLRELEGLNPSYP